MDKRNKLLISGDSFSSSHLAGEFGWPTLLSADFDITNTSYPGVGEYKILQQLKSQNLDLFDAIVIAHTSPNRIHCERNPLYPPGHIYSKSDIIFADVENKNSKELVGYFADIFDFEYYKFVHTMCCREIDQLTQNRLVIHLTNFEWTGLYQFENLTNFYNLWIKNKGKYVHYNIQANQYIAQLISKKIHDFCL